MKEDKGVFTLSLDTELAWGTFDIGSLRDFEHAYRRTPEVIEQLCVLFDKYEIPATWALVSHLLVDCDGEHERRASPKFEWIDEWFDSLPCSRGMDRELWYAPWLLDRLRDCDTAQDIGLHGATHMQLGAAGCGTAAARDEVETAVETLRKLGVEPKSFVFPRNDIGHREVLAECGIEVYRGGDARWYERPPTPETLKAPLRFLDESLHWTPSVVRPRERGRVVEIPGSQVFRPSWNGWQHTPAESTVNRAKKGLNRAAKTGDVFHLWFHPFNLGHRPEDDLRRLEQILSTAQELRQNGDIECQSMAKVAALTRQGRWN